MQPIAADIPYWSLCCVLGTIMSSAKMADPIMMPFWGVDSYGQD